MNDHTLPFSWNLKQFIQDILHIFWTNLMKNGLYTRALSSMWPMWPGHAWIFKQVAHGSIRFPNVPIRLSYNPPGRGWPKGSNVRPVMTLTTLSRLISSPVKTENSRSEGNMSISKVFMVPMMWLFYSSFPVAELFIYEIFPNFQAILFDNFYVFFQQLAKAVLHSIFETQN